MQQVEHSAILRVIHNEIILKKLDFYSESAHNITIKKNKEVAVMDNDKKVEFSDREIDGIAKAIALAELAARSPKEKDPSIPMTKDDRYYQSLENVMKKYNALKAEGKI